MPSRPHLQGGEELSVRKQCKGKGCADENCGHPLWFDVMHRRRRYRMRVEEFVAPRLAEGARFPVTLAQARRVWEPIFRAEILAGNDPRGKRACAATPVETVGDLIDAY